MALREEVLGQKYLSGAIQWWLIVSKTLLKSLELFVDSSFTFKWRVNSIISKKFQTVLVIIETVLIDFYDLKVSLVQ